MRDALALAGEQMTAGRKGRNGWKRIVPADILEAAFGEATPREMLRLNGHPAVWAMRFVALELSGRDPIEKPARRPKVPKAAV